MLPRRGWKPCLSEENQRLSVAAVFFHFLCCKTSNMTALIKSAAFIKQNPHHPFVQRSVWPKPTASWTHLTYLILHIHQEEDSCVVKSLCIDRCAELLQAPCDGSLDAARYGSISAASAPVGWWWRRGHKRGRWLWRCRNLHDRPRMWLSLGRIVFLESLCVFFVIVVFCCWFWKRLAGG